MMVMQENTAAKPIDTGTSIVPMQPGAVPRRWQVESMVAIREGLKKYSRILISAATGTGKGTMIAALIVKAIRAGKRVLFLVHMDELIDDVMARARLIEPAIEAGKVKGKVNEVTRQAVFASVQSLHKRRLPSLGHFDFVITDEAHHATAKSYRNIYARLLEVNPKCKHIGFTATPFRSAPKGKTGGLGITFEALVYEYSLSDAINDGALCQVRGLQVETTLDLSGVDPDDEEAVAKIVDTEERNAIVAEKFLELVPDKQAICFATNIAHATHIAAAMVEKGINADAVWGDDPKRAQKISDYKAGKLQVLCNCDLLREGFDAPATSAVLLVRPTQSRGLYAQQVGRVTRLYPGKDEGLVIDFVANSKTHSLASMHDMSGQGHSRQRIKPGDLVKHRRNSGWGQGDVSEVRDWVSDDEQGEAIVGWPSGPRGDWIPCGDLLIVTKGAEPKEILIAPSVVGVNHFAVSLFSANQTAWYIYESSGKKTYVAKGQNNSAIVRKREDGQWEAWERVKNTIGGWDAPQLRKVGTFGQCEVAVYVPKEEQGLDRAWQSEPASDKQLATLKKFNVNRDGLSKGEAAQIMELKIMGIEIRKHSAGMLQEEKVGYLPEPMPIIESFTDKVRRAIKTLPHLSGEGLTEAALLDALGSGSGIDVRQALRALGYEIMQSGSGVRYWGRSA